MTLAQTIYRADTWDDLDDKDRCAIKDWLIANDVDPYSITSTEPVTVTDDGTIRYWAMDVERRDGRYLKVKTVKDDDGKEHPYIEERTAPLKVPFTAAE